MSEDDSYIDPKDIIYFILLPILILIAEYSFIKMFETTVSKVIATLFCIAIDAIAIYYIVQAYNNHFHGG